MRVSGNVNREELDLQKSLQERLGENASRQRDLQQQIFERDKRLFDLARERFAGPQQAAIQLAGATGMPGFAGPAMFGADMTNQFGRGALNQDIKRQLDNAQQALDALVDAIKDAAVRAGEVETIKKQLDAAHTN